MKKGLLVGLAVVLLVSLGGLIGCGGGGIAGIYVSPHNPNDYLELLPDGTFYLQEGWSRESGEWEVRGDELTLSFSSEIFVVRIQGNNIITPDGEVWAKQKRR